MRKRRIGEEHLVRFLRDADRGSVAAVTRKHGVREQTLYTWRTLYKDSSAAAVQRRR